jgi:hypothetical protein
MIRTAAALCYHGRQCAGGPAIYALGVAAEATTKLHLSSWNLAGLSRRAWQIALLLSAAMLAAGTLGFMMEELPTGPPLRPPPTSSCRCAR